MSASRPPPAPARNIGRRVLHELRTPLGQIIGYAEMLQEEMDDRGLDALAGDTRKIQAAARRMLQLLEDLFQQESPGRTPAAAPEAAAAPPALTTPQRGSGERLLLVDDEADNRELLERRLTKAGYDVRVAEDGTRALHAIESGSFDLVLLDVLMPGLSGIEVLDAIRRTRSASELPVVMATALTGSDEMVEALRRGANDYVTKPFDLPVVLARVESQLAVKRAAAEVTALAQQLEINNAFIRRTFGRYVSDEVVDDLLERPEGLELSGETRRVTVLMSDLRGFSTLSASLGPTQVVSLLNTYLGRMAEIVQDYGGTIDEFLGDAVLAFFGAPTSRADDAERAVAAAVAMQLAMEEVNRVNRGRGLPAVEIGIGIATGDAIVGNIGSERRSKYGAVGSPVNLAGRIESYTLGGDVLICPATFAATETILRAEAPREVHPKGFEAPIALRRVLGVGGAHDLSAPDLADEWKDLVPEVPVRFSRLEGKHVSDPSGRGHLSAISRGGAQLRSSEALPELTDLRLEILDPTGVPQPDAFYAKVARGAAEPGAACVLRFTSRSPALDRILAG